MKWLGGLVLLLLLSWGVAHARPERTQLPNGLQVITERVPEMPLAALEVWVRAGTAHETPETSGVAHLLEHLLFKGTRNSPKGALDAVFERSGGLLEANTERDWVRFRATVLKDRWQEPLQMLLAHLFEPLLPEGELERERAIILGDEYALHWLSPVRVARYQLFAERFPEHPYGLPLLGDPKRLRQSDIQTVRAFHHQHYVPSNFVVVLVGDVVHEEVLRAVADTLSASMSPHPPQPSLSQGFGRGRESRLPSPEASGEGQGVRATQNLTPPAPLSANDPARHSERSEESPLSHSVGEGQGVRADPEAHGRDTRATVGEGQGVRADPEAHGRDARAIVGEGQGVRADPEAHGRDARATLGEEQGVREVLTLSLPAPPAHQTDALILTELLRIALAEPYLGLLYARFSENETRLPFSQLRSEFLPRTQQGLVAFFFLPPIPEMPDWQAQVKARWQTALERITSGQARGWLEQAKSIAITRHQLQMANPIERARLYGLYATLNIPNLPNEWVARVQAVPPEAIEAYLRQLLEGQTPAKIETERAPTPPPAERTTPQLGSPVRLRLANGIRIIHLPTQNSDTLHLQLILHTPPSLREPRGVAELTARLLFTSTQNETEATLAYRMARSGGSLRLFWEPNGIRVAVVARTNSLQNMLSLLAEGFLRPEFTPEAFQRAKAIALAERRWSDGAREWNAYSALTDFSTEESLQRVSLADVRRFYQACFRPENLVVVSAGNLRPEQVSTFVNQFFGSGWSVEGARTRLEPPAQPNLARTTLTRSAEGLTYWAYRFDLPIQSPEQVATGLVLQTVLSGGKGSRLFREIREGLGWGYDFGGIHLLEPHRLQLLGFIQAGCPSEKPSSLLTERMTQPLRAEEVQRAKAYLIGNWWRDRMELSEYLRRLAEAELSGVGIELETEFPKWIEAVSLEAVQGLMESFRQRIQADQPYLPTNGTNTHSP